MAESKEPYEVIVLGPESSPEECMRGLLQLVLQQSAKQIECAIEVLSEKYGHSKEEMCAVVRDAPKMRAVLKEEILPPFPPQGPTTTKGGKKVVIRKKAVKSVVKEVAQPSEGKEP